MTRRRRALQFAAIAMAFVAGLLVNDRIGTVQGQQKKAPGEGANPAFLVGKPWPGVW
jgi:hypothetical protein